MSQDINLSKDDRQLLYDITAEWVRDNHPCTRNDVEADDIARATRLRDRFLKSCPWLGSTPSGEVSEVDDMNRLRVQAQRRLSNLEAACREEHGGKFYEWECPICVALDGEHPGKSFTASGSAEQKP